MRNTKLMLALASVGLAGLAVSHPASAQIATSNSGNSDLLFVAVDTVTGETFYGNLGALALTSSGPTVPATSYNLAGIGGSAWTTFESNVKSDVLNYAVIGGGNKNGASDPLLLNSYSTTVGGTTAPGPVSNGNLAQFNLLDQNIINPLNSGSADVTSGGGYDVKSQTGIQYTDANGLTSWNGDFSGITVVAEGSQNAFYNLTQNKTATTTTASPSNQTLLGTFSFSGSTLSFTAAGGGSPVPLPAPIWLVASGLAGLLSVGRRKAA
jgi:hypothetical protein